MNLVLKIQNTLGALVPLVGDALGNLKVHMSTLISGEDQENNLLRVASAGYRHAPTIVGEVADTQVGTGAGVLHHLNITVAGTATATINVYDGVVDGDNLIGVYSGSATGTIIIDAYCATSMHIEIADSVGDSAAMCVVPFYLE